MFEFADVGYEAACALGGEILQGGNLLA
jgi:hypothetical protein